jgi:FkbM family methyltransferase
MKALQNLYTKTLLYHLYQEFWIRYYFKYVLPKIQEINLEGLRLDVSTLSPKIRNRLLHAGYEEQEKQMCQDFLSPQDCVVEIGGAIGFIGLICQKRIGIKEYTVFEANPATFEILKRNYALNGLSANVHNMALAHEDGQVELEVGSDFWENSIVYERDPAHGRTTVRVPAASLSTILRVSGGNANVLILDVEGAEQFIDFEQIPEQINKIIIELHPKVLGPEMTYNIVASLISKGFRVAREEQGTFVFLRK